MTQFIDQINSFCKLAGLLKTPDRVLKEATDWVCSKYCWLLSYQIATQLNQFKNRNKLFDSIYPKISKWENVINLMSSIRPGATSTDYLQNKIDALIDECEKNNEYAITFPNFDPFKTNQLSMSGFIAPPKAKKSLSFSLIKNDNDTYNLILAADYNGKLNGPDSPDADIHFSIWETDISLIEVAKLISENYSEIEQIVIAMLKLPNYYDTYTDQYMNQLTMVYAHCKKIASKFSESEYSSRLGKRITISSKNFDYTKNTNREASFFIDLDTNINNNKYLGLWSSHEDKNNDFLGRVTIAAKFNNIESLVVLKEKLSEITETTRHEVQHTIQTFIAHIKNLKEVGGLPSKNIRDSRLDGHGVPRDQGNFPSELMDHEDKSNRIDHRLRDIEFYTRLSDEVGDFNKSKQILPLSLHEDFAKTWINQISIKDFISIRDEKLRLIALKELKIDSDIYIHTGDSYNLVKSFKYRTDSAIYALNAHTFFSTLQKEQPNKYRKAVAEFMKAVDL